MFTKFIYTAPVSVLVITLASAGTVMIWGLSSLLWL